MKKIIIFLAAVFLMLNTYAQDECAEFDKAWIVSSGVNIYSEISIVNSNNNIFIIGRYSGSSASIGSIGLPTPPSPWEGAFIAKMDTLGNVIWATPAIGQGAGRMLFHSADLDNSGNIYISGVFNGTVNFQGNILTSNNIAASNNFDGFIAKLDADGQVQWIEVQPGAFNFYIVADNNKSNFYIASRLLEQLPTIINQDTFYSLGSSDILITKINTQGQVQFVQQIGGKGTDIPYSMSIDNNDNVYLSGTITDTAYFGAYALYPANNNGVGDMFVTKMSSQGSFEWATQAERITFGSRFNSVYHSLTPQGNIYVYGRYQGSFDFGGTILNASKPIAHYLTVLDLQGQILYTEEIMPSDTMRNILQGAVDEYNNLYLAGYFEGTSEFGDTTLTATKYDVFVSKIQPEAGGSKFLWTLQSIGQGYEFISQPILIKSNELYISGVYNDGDAVFGEHTLPAPPAGYYHGYIAKISECEPSNINEPNPLAKISIFPNPANTQITITNLPANSKVSISDIMGKVIYQQETMHRTIHIPTQHWSSGMYIVSVSHNGIVTHKKVAIK